MNTVSVRQTSWILLLLLVLLACSLQVSCASKKKIADEDIPPWSTVITLYDEAWDSQQSAFFNSDLTKEIFAPPLSNLIQTAVNRNKLARLDIDPLYIAKNAEIKNLYIAKPVYLAVDHSTVAVTFININEPVKIQVDVILLETGKWKIANIRYPDNTDLISLLIN